jgi:Holliday junction resolvase
LAPRNQKTTLTPDDGRASRDIGDKTEEEFASTFRSAGVGVDRRKAQGNPDITLLSSDGTKVVAVVNTKSYMLYDEPKRNQRHISPEDIIPEIIAAQKHKVPVIIAVKNRSNGRKWLYLIPFEQVADWKGVSTPVMLSKNDTESGNELKEIFQKMLRQLGTKV